MGDDEKMLGAMTEEDRHALAMAMVRKADAEASKAQAEAKAADLMAARTELENRRLTLEIVPVEIATDKALRARQEDLAANKFHHVYTFNDGVNAGSVKSCIDQLTQWSRLDKGCAMEIVFNSPGGDVVNGMALFDFIQQLRKVGHYITTSTVGYAASMAGILLQAGDKRVMGRQSWLLIHEASFGAGGKIGDVEDTVEWVKMVMDRVLDIFADRCQGAKHASKPLTKRQIATKWRRKDWWISADDALDYGLVDEVGPAHLAASN